MRIYNITVVLKEQGTKTDQIKKATIILAESDSLDEFIQMMYGCWFDIISYKYEEADIIHISKNYIAKEAMKMIRFN